MELLDLTSAKAVYKTYCFNPLRSDDRAYVIVWAFRGSIFSGCHESYGQAIFLFSDLMVVYLLDREVSLFRGKNIGHILNALKNMSAFS